jgi:hypothetical protein
MNSTETESFGLSKPDKDLAVWRRKIDESKNKTI